MSGNLCRDESSLQAAKAHLQQSRQAQAVAVNVAKTSQVKPPAAVKRPSEDRCAPAQAMQTMTARALTAADVVDGRSAVDGAGRSALRHELVQVTAATALCAWHQPAAMAAGCAGVSAALSAAATAASPGHASSARAAHARSASTACMCVPMRTAALQSACRSSSLSCS